MDAQTLLHKQGKDEARAYEAVTCPACMRLHFIEKATGKAVGSDKCDWTEQVYNLEILGRWKDLVKQPGYGARPTDQRHEQ